MPCLLKIKSINFFMQIVSIKFIFPLVDFVKPCKRCRRFTHIKASFLLSFVFFQDKTRAGFVFSLFCQTALIVS